MLKSILLALNTAFISLILIASSRINLNPNPYFLSLNECHEERYLPNKKYFISYYLRKDIDYLEVSEEFKGEKDIYIEGKECFNSFKYNKERYQIIVIDFTLARPLIRDELSLTVSYKDQSYSLSLGSFNIVPRASNTLNFNYLELHFKYLNNNLLPIGLTLELGEALELKSLALGKLQGDLTKISLNIPKTSIIEEIPTDGYKNNLLKPNERVFIPFKYEKLLLFQNYNLEIEADTNYFIDYSLGLLSFKRLKDFTGFIKEYGYD